MNKIIDSDHHALQRRFLQHLLENLHVLKNNKRIVIGLSGGNSLRIFYEILKENFWRIEEDIREKIYFCFLDERVVNFEDDDSNYRLVRKMFLDELVATGLLKAKNILLPDFSLGDYTMDYFQKVKKIDIGLIGVGEDGHICSLFPNHKLLDDTAFAYLSIDDSPKAPAKRITVSKPMLQDIHTAFVFFMGTSKKSALDRFLEGNADYRICPAKLVIGCRNSILFSDLC